MQFRIYLICVWLFFLGQRLEAILIDNSWSLAQSNALATNFAEFASFSAVGKVNVWEGASSYYGTGVLIGSDWVLTAAHNWDAGLMTNMSFNVGGSNYTANLANVYQHTNWTSAPSPLANKTVGSGQGWDIALFRLTSSVSGIAPAPLYTGNSEHGKQVYTLGFGSTGTGTATSTPNTSGNVHAIANVVDRVTNQSHGGFSGGALYYDFDSGLAGGNTFSVGGVPDESSFLTSLNPSGTIVGSGSNFDQVMYGGSIVEGGTAAGDSGGPSFILDDGVWKVAGLTSWGVNPATGYGFNGLYGDITAMTRVSAHIDWIAGISGVPEPETWGVVLGGVALVVVILRRYRV